MHNTTIFMRSRNSIQNDLRIQRWLMLFIFNLQKFCIIIYEVVELIIVELVVFVLFVTFASEERGVTFELGTSITSISTLQIPHRHISYVCCFFLAGERVQNSIVRMNFPLGIYRKARKPKPMNQFLADLCCIQARKLHANTTCCIIQIHHFVLFYFSDKLIWTKNDS